MPAMSQPCLEPRAAAEVCASPEMRCAHSRGAGELHAWLSALTPPRPLQLKTSVLFACFSSWAYPKIGNFTFCSSAGGRCWHQSSSNTAQHRPLPMTPAVRRCSRCSSNTDHLENSSHSSAQLFSLLSCSLSHPRLSP